MFTHTLCINSFTLADNNNIEIRTIEISRYGIDRNGELSGSIMTWLTYF